ncbi:MAG: flagellar hook-basal body protein [bacterium]
MDRGLYTATTGMLVQEIKLDYISNNLANVNTTGFKQNAGAIKSFPQMLVHRLNDTYLKVSGIEGNMDLRPMVGLNTMGAVVDEIATDFTKGNFQPTENKFDLAIDGQGFFVVDTPFGERLTRSGNFTINANKELVTKLGYRVMGENGPLVLDGKNFNVDETGVIYVGAKSDEYLDKIKVVTVDDYKTIKKVGHDMFTVPKELPQPYIAKDLTIRQGVLEQSNVNTITMLRSMIDVMRTYEANSKVVTTKDALIGQAANEIAKL